MKNEMQQQQKSLEHKENEKKEKEGEAEDCLQSSLIKAHAHKWTQNSHNVSFLSVSVFAVWYSLSTVKYICLYNGKSSRRKWAPFLPLLKHVYFF